MPDNFTNNNDHLTDLGWQRMQALLDREMPLEKKRRRAVAFWWLALLFVGAGLGSYYVYRQYANSHFPHVAERPVASSEKSIHPDNSEIPGQMPYTNENQPTATNHAMAAPVAAPTQRQPGPRPTGNGVKPVRNLETAAAATSAQPIRPDSGSDLPQPTVPSIPENTDRSLLSGAKTATVDILPALPPAPLSLEQENLAMPARLHMRKAAVRTHVGAYAGMFTQQFGSVDGFETGAFAQIALHKKWSLELGLGYQELTNSLRINVDSATGRVEAFVQTNNSGGALMDFAGNSNGSGNGSESRVTFRYLRLQTNLHYAITPSWSIMAGAGTGYLLGTRQSNDFTLAGKSSSNFPNAIVSNNGTLPMDAFNRWDVSINMGMEYRPLKQLGVTLQYRHGLTDYTSQQYFSNRTDDRQKQFQLGIRYKFR